MSFTAKSVIFDIADNWGDGSYVGYRSVELKIDGALQNPLSTAMTGYDTSHYFDPIHAFKSDVSKTGESTTINGWTSDPGATTNQRTSVVFDDAITFDSIVINNYHHNGGSTTRGAKNVKITISSDSITDATYGATISNSTLIFDGQFDQHVASNTADDQEITLIIPTFFNITYNGNGNDTGAVPVDSTDYEESDIVTVLGNTGSLAKTDHAFSGWNTAASGAGTSYYAGDTFSMGTEDVTLYAVWDVVFAQLNMGLSLGAGDIIGDAHTTLSPLETGMYLSGTLSESVPATAFSMGVGVGIGEIRLGVDVQLEPFNLGLSAGFGNVTQNIALSPLKIGLTFDGSPMQSIPVQPFEIGLAMDMDGISSFETGSAIIRYFCILTGAADGTTDLTLPMASFQARRRSGDPTYLSVVIPTVDYADEIAARPNGTLKIQQAYEQNGVIKQTETIMETSLDEVNPDEGGTNQSVTLVGYSTATYSAKAVTLSGVTYRSTRGGKYHYRLAKPYIFLNPGDTVTFSDDGVSFAIDTMTYFINPTTSTIELASV